MLKKGSNGQKENQERKMNSTIKVPLDLPNVEVLQTEINKNGDSIITVESTQKGTNCKDCGREIDKFHAYDQAIEARHLPILNRRVYIRMRPIRYECPDCSDKGKKATTTQRVDWYNPKNSLTRAYEDHLLLSVINSTIQDVSKKERIGYDMVRGVMRHRINHKVDWSKIETLESLGIDEIALRKGHHDFVAIITARLSDGTIILLAVLADRTKAVVKAFLESIPLHLRKTVHSICTDMWEGYINAVREVFGEKVSIVIDRFHVAKSYREAVEHLRKSEMKRLKQELSEAEYKQLKGVLWALRKKPSALSDDEIVLLARLFSLAPNLKKAYALREELTAIFDANIDTSIAKEKLQQWQQRVTESGLQCFNAFLTSLTNWFDEILHYFERRLTSGFVEGLNNKIKVIKRRCYGILRPEHLFQRIFLDLNGFRLFLPDPA